MKRTLRILWAFNGLLAAAILAFGARCLVWTPKVDRLAGLDPHAALPSPRTPAILPNEDSLKTLANPMGPRPPAPPVPDSTISLHGALPTVGGDIGVAILSTGPNVSWVLPIGEEVDGWRLVEVWKDRAAFTNARGDRRELEIRTAQQR